MGILTRHYIWFINNEDVQVKDAAHPSRVQGHTNKQYPSPILLDDLHTIITVNRGAISSGHRLPSDVTSLISSAATKPRLIPLLSQPITSDVRF